MNGLFLFCYFIFVVYVDICTWAIWQPYKSESGFCAYGAAPAQRYLCSFVAARGPAVHCGSSVSYHEAWLEIYAVEQSGHLASCPTFRVRYALDLNFGCTLVIRNDTLDTTKDRRSCLSHHMGCCCVMSKKAGRGAGVAPVSCVDRCSSFAPLLVMLFELFEHF